MSGVRQRTRVVDAEATPEERTVEGQVGYVHVQRVAYGQEHNQLEEVRVPVFHNDPARVRVGGSVTQGQGDFNFAKVTVEIEMPCLPEYSEVDRVYFDLSTRVDNMLRRELEIATGGTINAQTR